MTRYQLVAARDGVVVNQTALLRDRLAAETWAVGMLASSFGLAAYSLDGFEAMVAETDGCELLELKPDPVALAAIALLRTLSPETEAGSGGSLQRETIDDPSVLHAAGRLAAALQRAGYWFPPPAAAER